MRTSSGNTSRQARQGGVLKNYGGQFPSHPSSAAGVSQPPGRKLRLLRTTTAARALGPKCSPRSWSRPTPLPGPAARSVGPLKRPMGPPKQARGMSKQWSRVARRHATGTYHACRMALKLCSVVLDTLRRMVWRRRAQVRELRPMSLQMHFSMLLLPARLLGRAWAVVP
mmetsp:Transcript_179266/g.568862  ORF Transcript_179266/g.568862 Transcript_179266/m.568862 type:complete len:169 (-) Transcript_179266:2558-3064(-)